jgi:site-specific DNA-cytosine methylase
MPTILELFSGTQCISNTFRDKGWKAFTIENDPFYEDTTSWVADISKITGSDILERMDERPKVIWASPPCQAFSVASIGYHWTGGEFSYIPKTDFAIFSQELVKHTIEIIKEINPEYFFIENPRGMLRKQPFMKSLPFRHTVTYCQYGGNNQKATDIWHNHPHSRFKPPCNQGDSCHEASPRGTNQGTMKDRSAKVRAMIPRGLCEHIYEISSEKLGEQLEEYFWGSCP